MKYVLIPLAFVGIVLLGAAFEWPQAQAPLSSQTQGLRHISIGSTTISVEIADTGALRTQGLSGRTTLPEGSGMLFVFEGEGNWGFWMKDMQFSIDIIWADSEGRIITIAHNVAPKTYPSSFYPNMPTARYVLEVPGGFSKRRGIADGMRFSFSQN